MAERIVFLGTGGGDSVGKQLRASGGIIVQSDDHQFHIDPGPGALVRAREFNVNLRENTAVLISHSHLGHVNDVNAVISSMTLSGIDKKGVLTGEETAIKGSENIRPYVTDFYKNCVEKYIILKQGQKLGIDNIEINTLETRHSVNCIGFKIFTPRFSLCYTADTGYSARLANQYKGVDVLVLNVLYPLKTKETEHNLNTMGAIKIVERARPKLAVITHFGLQMLEENPIYEAREIQKRTKVQTIAANDGLNINPILHSERLRQKTLNTFDDSIKTTLEEKEEEE